MKKGIFLKERETTKSPLRSEETAIFQLGKGENTTAKGGEGDFDLCFTFLYNSWVFIIVLDGSELNLWLSHIEYFLNG